MKGLDFMIKQQLANLNKETMTKFAIRLFKDWGIPVIVAFIIYLIITRFLLFKVFIPSVSMVPTLNVEDQLFVSKIYYLDNIKRGDVLVFKSDQVTGNNTLIKRVIGLPGDVVSIDNGVTSINGEKLNEEYVEFKDNKNGSYQVPEGKYFFRGDNRANSFDSSEWDDPYVDGEDIMGKAFIKVYPFSDIGFIE